MTAVGHFWVNKALKMDITHCHFFHLQYYLYYLLLIEATRKQYYNLKNHKEKPRTHKNTRTIYPNPKPAKGLSFIIIKAVFIQSKNTVKSEIF